LPRWNHRRRDTEQNANRRDQGNAAIDEDRMPGNVCGLERGPERRRNGQAIDGRGLLELMGSIRHKKNPPFVWNTK
jgi:hypothetical protein